MIDVRELRIGNWVLEYQIPAKVESIYENGENSMINVLLDSSDIMLLGTYVSGVEPIPLTPAILEQCGFHERTPKTFSGGQIYIKPKVGRVIIFKTGCAFSLYNSRSRIPLTSVHELQNIIHTLTGEELTINLTQTA